MLWRYLTALDSFVRTVHPEPMSFHKSPEQYIDLYGDQLFQVDVCAQVGRFS